MQKAYKDLPVGISNFKDVIDENYYYVDKTMVLKDLIDQFGKVFFMLRPRRFGKSLLLSMVQTFFEDGRDGNGSPVDNSRYFEGAKILSCGDTYTKEMGKYPVIHMSLKDGAGDTAEDTKFLLREVIKLEFKRHNYVLDSLDYDDRERFLRLSDGTAERQEYLISLKFLSGCLYAYHKKRVIVLIDEYDVPMEKAWNNGYYDEMVSFMRIFLSSGLKDNSAVGLGVVSGCLRIAKESIYTGLNNLSVISILNEEYDEYFGFTDDETAKLLLDYDLTDKEDEVKQWYDGYLFGNCNVYNPWSILNYVQQHKTNHDKLPAEYWSNTSSNDILRTLLQKASVYARDELEILLAGGAIEKRVHEDMTYEELDLPPGENFEDNIWNILLFTGYLRLVSIRLEDTSLYVKLCIPNAEVKEIFRNQISGWLKDRSAKLDGNLFGNILKSGDADGVKQFIGKELADTVSYMDSAEAFYHGFMAGLLQIVPQYKVLSNREAGEGRYDLVMVPVQDDPLMIFELKYTKERKKMQDMAQAALEQIHEKKYDAPYMDEYDEIVRYGICFCGKSLRVAAD